MRQCSRIAQRVAALARPFRQVAVAGCLAALAVGAAASARDEPALCDMAAAEASARTGVPIEVLQAVALVETGRSLSGARGGFRPWPWTVNQGGDGHWFATREEAAAHVGQALAAGQTNIDIGCFQINHRWHSGAFASVEDMLDPRRNALYAASYLQRLYTGRGDWSEAAGAYHSATPAHAERYRQRFDTVLARLKPDTLPSLPPAEDLAALLPRANRFPLLVSGAPATQGSIVPLREGRQPLFGNGP
ncbi:lytic transglycosylase domain-containing protein [Paracoccaceae bacterium Fryx2]|nr:lytic transglycosylase domain-containing protein [Paracoccaceae bacterium Fryx2]